MEVMRLSSENIPLDITLSNSVGYLYTGIERAKRCVVPQYWYLQLHSLSPSIRKDVLGRYVNREYLQCGEIIGFVPHLLESK